ncbi:uncharacterized protein LOC122834391 isoform X2 [Gambusia affinis]|uniref:uncharacterized protein LOC122834391 isoform X2 n=1 Tax=Gambusia affinis TaxID=33528 RepID=UPI001CDCA135|nr:uncharacterized protein LOC122834391 isoform X2 [Gambusia affinis]
MAEREPNVVGKLPIPRVVAPAQKTRRGRRKKSKDEKQAQKKELDRARNKTRINIGAAFLRWRELLYLKRFKSDAELATFLLDKCQVGDLTSLTTTSHQTALSSSVSSSSSDRISLLDTHDDINESDFNHIQNSVIDWAEDWTRPLQDDTGDVSASEEESSMGEGSYHDDTDDDDEEEEEEDYIPPLCVRTAGSGEQKFSLDALPAVGMEDTVHDALVTESAESQPAQSEDDITNHPAAITYHVCLMQLAQYLLLPIPVCTAKDPVTLVECQATGPFQVQVKSRGTAVIMQWMCSNNHCVWEWNSQPTFKDGMQAGDFLLASNIILSGNNYAKVALLFKFMKMGIVDWSTFLKIQDTYCVGTIKDFWDNSRADVVSRLKSKENVAVLADGHMNSLGSSAQFCTYTIMENETKEILSIVNIDKGETRRSSVMMEREGFIRSFQQIHQEVKLTEVCTDSQSQISTLFDPVKGKYKDSGVLHTLDMWHGSKDLAKKMHAAGQQKGCSILLQWIKDICNYFWFCCKMTENYENFYEMWAGLLNHVTGEQEWPLDAGQRPSGERRDKVWIENGSVAHQALSEVILNQRWLKEVHKYLHFRSTADLESFHNHILMYASKHFSFSRPVYEARIFLAGLDYNHHVHRPAKRKPDGSVEYRKLYNRKSRKWCLYAIKEEKDYRYIRQIQRAIVGKRVASGRGLPRLTAATRSDPRQYGVLFVAPASSSQQPLKLQVSRGQSVQERLVLKEEAKEEQSSGGDQQDAQRLHIKEEEEEVWSSMEDEELSVKEETDPCLLPLNVVVVKSEHEDKPLFSQLHQPEVGDLPTSSSADQMKAESDEEDGGGAESSRNPDLHTDRDTSSSSETEVSGDEEEEDDDDVNHPGSHLKHPPDSGSETEDSENDWKETRAAESGGNGANKPLSCSKCSQQFGNKSSLQRHSSRKNCSSKNVVSANVQTDLKGFTCDDCGKGFSLKNSLNRHLRIHTGEKPFNCDVCGQKFNQKSHLKIHRRIHTGEKPFSCNTCEVRFNQKSSLNLHMRNHSEEKPFHCDDCEQRFNKKSDLNKHKRAHMEEKPFGCDVCRKKFSRKADLNMHARVHTGDKPYACDVCGQTFSLKANLKKHMRIHTGDKPFGCLFCEQRFNRRSHLNIHIRIHTGEKPFVCDVCGQRFSDKSAVNKHMRIHTGDKPFGCDVCGKGFNQKSSLNKHIRIHTGDKPFGCEICGQSFNQKSTLNIHQRIHTGDKPFGCHVCGQRFNHKSNLNKHKRIHTGEKPYGCHICGIRFYQKPHLNRHMRVHIGEDVV